MQPIAIKRRKHGWHNNSANKAIRKSNTDRARLQTYTRCFIGMLDPKSDLWKSFFLAHRVVGSGGDLTGYTGGLKVKQASLELEQFHDK